MTMPPEPPDEDFEPIDLDNWRAMMPTERTIGKPNGRGNGHAKPANAAADDKWHTELRNHLCIYSWATLDIPPPVKHLGSIITSGSRTLIAGAAGLGKSMLVHGAGAALASGNDFLHWEGSGKPARVLIIDGEMSPFLLKSRAASLVQYNQTMPPNLFVYSVLYADKTRERYPHLAPYAPLNTPDGHQFLVALIDAVRPDIVFYDNLMSLLSGTHKDEEPWAEAKPVFFEITGRGIAQVFLDHTGLDRERVYGTSTKLIHMDTVAIMEGLNDQPRPGGGAEFSLSFGSPHGKARNRDDENWRDYQKMIVKLDSGVWTSRPVTTDPLEATTTTSPAGRAHRTKLAGNTKIGADMLRRALSRHAAALPQGVDYPPDVIAVTDEQWRQTFYQGIPGENTDSKRRYFNRAKKDLLARQVVASMNDYVWFARKGDE